MRGKRSLKEVSLFGIGITPAHAGKTVNNYIEVQAGGDHPRACGENHLQGRNDSQFLGSPPRMRGKPRVQRRYTRGAGITPAHAGKTEVIRMGENRRGDHPRACGENYKGRHRFSSFQGSPPRMRGKHRRMIVKARLTGITPAHAGKTIRPRTAATRRRDHPRACGENASPTKISSCRAGSPPRMRGKPCHTSAPEMPVGITPAHAGKTGFPSLRPRPAGDHPRACGENGGRGMNRESVTGSPPRMRGKPLNSFNRSL